MTYHPIAPIEIIKLTRFANIVKNDNNNLLTYQPQWYQEKFHFNEKFIRVLSWANKQGKTLSSVAEFCMHITGIYPDWFPEHLRMKGKVRGRIIIQSFGNVLSLDLYPFLLRYIPGKMIKKRSKNMGNEIYLNWLLTNGNQFSIMSDEQETKEFEGAELELLLINEPCKRENFIASMRGMTISKTSKIICALTPVAGMAWLFDEIAMDIEKCWINYIDIYQNKYMDEQKREEFISSLTEEEKVARTTGKPSTYYGAILKDLSRDIHVIPYEDIPYDYPRIQVVDPAEAKGFASIWGAVNPMDELYIYDYMLQENMSIKELGEMFKTKESNRKIDRRLMDAAYVNKPQLQNKTNDGRLRTLNEEFIAQCNLSYSPTIRDIMLRISAVREYLKWDKSQPLGVQNRPKIYIMDNCIPVIEQMERWIWNEKTGLPKQENSDLPDCVGYLCVTRPKFNEFKSTTTRSVGFVRETRKYSNF